MSETVLGVWKNSAAVTGLSREEWLAFFDPHREKPHSELAVLAHQKLTELAADDAELAQKNLHWWAQGVTVAFEQETGRRKVNQRCDGSFGASASKTLNGTIDEIAKQWNAFAAANLPSVNGVPFTGEPRITQTEKWRYWRVNTLDGAAVSVNITAKAPAKDGTPKSVISTDIQGLNSAEESTEYKAAFKEVLAEFAKGVAG